jgi:hypothetical protein
VALRDFLDRVLRRRVPESEPTPQRPEGMPTPEEAADAGELQKDLLDKHDENVARRDPDEGRYTDV